MSNPDSTLIGTSCLVWWENVLVLELQKPGKWHLDADGQVHLGLGCIGGSLEKGESALEALQREALEEMGCGIALLDAPQSWAVTPDCKVLERTWNAPGTRPVMVWEACLPGLLPGRKVAVFRGRPLAEPLPGDLPALLLLAPEVLLAIGGAPMRLRDALSLGAVLRARAELPQAGWLELTGTPAVLRLLHIRKEPLAGMLLQPVTGLNYGTQP